MSLVKTWYTIAEAVSKFGVAEARILEWVEEGVVRSEQEGPKVTLINGDDMDLMVAERLGKE